MSVILIPSEHELPPCGNCGKTLRGGPPASLYIFDYFDEIGEEIKNGEINKNICPVCAYHGWVWSGLLMIDRGRARGVFVTHRTDVAAQEELLAQRLEEAREFLEAGTFEAVRENVVWVKDYRHIYELLCQDDEIFRAEVANSSAFRNRSAIPDLDERATQYVEDALRIRYMFMLREESSQEFVAAVLRALDRKRSQPDTLAEVAQRCASLRQQLEAAANSFAPPEADSSAHLRTAWANAEEPTEEQRRQGMSIFGAHELITALEQSSRRPVRSWCAPRTRRAGHPAPPSSRRRSAHCSHPRTRLCQTKSKCSPRAPLPSRRKRLSAWARKDTPSPRRCVEAPAGARNSCVWRPTSP